MNPLRKNRFASAACACWLTAGLLLAACGSSPKVQYFQLRSEPPEAVVAAAGAATATANATASAVWALASVQIPEYLDRDAIVRPSAQATLNVQTSERWAEPLRDAIPRLLQQDLGRLLGSERIWRLPLPPGLTAERQLRVEIQRLDADASGRSLLVLQARWILSDPKGRTPPEVKEWRIDVPTGDGGTDALAAAHRRALWELAKEIARPR